VTYRKGCRVGLATKPETMPPAPSDFSDPLLDHRMFHHFPVVLGDRRLEVASRPGVFSWDRLDPGTRCLLEAVKTIAPRDTVLDLGCGTGIVGVAAAWRAHSGRVYLVDDDVDAVESAGETVAANAAANCTVLASDSTAAVRDVRFDVVLTNPPFHVASRTDLDVTRQLLADVRPILKKTGRFYVVANRFLPYEEQLITTFGSVDLIYLDSHYKVLRAEVGRR
jgi:16S rRNA (guanine1207-N2)-methyltransferase